MGNTIKGRSIISVVSFLLVVVFCVVANSSVPKLYESYKEKEVAQQAATKVTHVIKKSSTAKSQGTTAPAETTEEPVAEEEANVYEIPVEEEEEETTEETSEEEELDVDEESEESTDTEDSGFLNKIVDFFTSIFDKLSSCKLASILKDFIAKILSLFGITL